MVDGHVNHWFRRVRNVDVVNLNSDQGKHHFRHSSKEMNEKYYQSDKKRGLLDSLNKSTKQRHSIN